MHQRGREFDVLNGGPDIIAVQVSGVVYNRGSITTSFRQTAAVPQFN